MSEVSVVAATLGKVTLEVDAEQTRHIYASIASGGAASCGCAYCRNFTAQLPGIFPEEVLAFFAECGLDPYKVAEVYEMGETRPGVHRYGGEYYFIYKTRPAIDTDVLSNGFEFMVILPTLLAPKEFVDAPGACCLNFSCEIPWVLNERP